MSTPVLQRTMELGEFDVMPGNFGLHHAVDPIEFSQSLELSPRTAILPQHPDARAFSVGLSPDLPQQRGTRHQVYFADMGVYGSTEDPDLHIATYPVAVKTYKKNMDPDNWVREIAALEMARRSGLETLTPAMLLNYGRGVLMATVFVEGLHDLEERFLGRVPEGYGIDQNTMLATSASALASQHERGMVNGDAAPRNVALQGPSWGGNGDPVLIDPETYKFPHEMSIQEIRQGHANDLTHLIREAGTLIHKKEWQDSIGSGAARYATPDELDVAMSKAKEIILPVYRAGRSHAIHSDQKRW